MKRIAVLISGGGTNLQALIDARDSGALPCEIACVISSNAGAYGLERAARAGIPAYVVTRAHGAARRDAVMLRILRKNRVDLVVLAGYLGILSSRFIAQYENKIVNIHPALLPKFGGVGMYGIHVHEAVIASGDTVTGATAHYVTEAVDGGAVIKQMTMDVLPGDTPASLQHRLLETVEHTLLVDVVRQLCIEN
ncbi:MAG: phosphoribosylglycinamide formyltransferase [Clostridiales bacterium]|jgi:phosphoribosylglycinamide formyltransferase-1|nr:phosphoribosylglycinamide formyltransferase [Clostridiales bacterium]